MKKHNPVLDVTNLAVRQVAEVKPAGEIIRVFECKYNGQCYYYALWRPTGRGASAFTLAHIEDEWDSASGVAIKELLPLGVQRRWGHGYRWIEMMPIACHMIQAHVLLLDEDLRKSRREVGQRHPGR